MPSSAPRGEPQSMVYSQGTPCLWQEIRISPRVDAATEPAVSVPSRDQWLRLCWDLRMVMEHKLGSVARQEDAEPGLAAASAFPLLSGRAGVAGTGAFWRAGTVLGAGAWLWHVHLLTGAGPALWSSLLVPCSLCRCLQPSAGLLVPGHSHQTLGPWNQQSHLVFSCKDRNPVTFGRFHSPAGSCN